MPYAYISAGSTTRVKDGPGLFKGLWVTPVSGGSVLVADNPDMGSAGPNFNALTSVTSTVGIHGTWPASMPPAYFDGFATRFQNALVVSATSSARVSVFFD